MSKRTIQVKGTLSEVVNEMLNEIHKKDIKDRTKRNAQNTVIHVVKKTNKLPDEGLFVKLVGDMDDKDDNILMYTDPAVGNIETQLESYLSIHNVTLVRSEEALLAMLGVTHEDN